MLIKVKVLAGMKRQEVVKKAEDSFEIKVKAKPEYGEANKEAMVALAAYFGIPESNIKIIKGHRRPGKIFSLTFPDL